MVFPGNSPQIANSRIFHDFCFLVGGGGGFPANFLIPGSVRTMVGDDHCTNCQSRCLVPFHNTLI